MPQPPEAPFGPETFAASAKVSRETMARLETYAAMLADWNSRHNLVAPASLADLWRRHFWDSAQIVPLIPATAKSLVDLGAGAGFPGLVAAELLRERRPLRIVLYEATGKKCRFLEAVARELDLEVEIRNTRIESASPESFDVILARALAPLPRLLDYAQRFWAPGTSAIFLKGQNVEVELTAAHKSWRFTLQRYPSASDPSGVILNVTDLRNATRRSDTKR